MSVTLEQFIQAIAGQESGGSYAAVNGRTGALGRYQILPGNILPWSQRYLGYAITPTQFLNNPGLQEALARAVLTSYYNTAGPRGAAAWWYSGNPDNANNYTRFRSNEPSIGEYVDQVLARAGQSYGGPVQHPVSSLPEAPPFDTVVQPPGGAAAGLEPLTGAAGLVSPLPAGISPEDPAGIAAAGTESAGIGSGGMAGPTPAQAKQVMDMADQATATLPDGVRNQVIALARQQLGRPYVWGGSSPAGFDCSGLLQYVFGQVGVSLPRMSWSQLRMGTPTALRDLQAGDLVGFDTGSHIALYLGNNQILEAPNSGSNVRIRTLGSNENAFGVSLASIYG